MKAFSDVTLLFIVYYPKSTCTETTKHFLSNCDRSRYKVGTFTFLIMCNISDCVIFCNSIDTCFE